MNTPRALHAGAVFSLVVLIVLAVAWELWLAPLRAGGSLLALKAVPLLLPLKGLLRRDNYTMQWSAMLVLIYLAEGAVRATSDTGVSALLGAIEAGLVLAYLFCTTLYLRPIKRIAKGRGV